MAAFQCSKLVELPLSNDHAVAYYMMSNEANAWCIDLCKKKKKKPSLIFHICTFGNVNSCFLWLGKWSEISQDMWTQSVWVWEAILHNPLMEQNTLLNIYAWNLRLFPQGSKIKFRKRATPKLTQLCNPFLSTSLINE